MYVHRKIADDDEERSADALSRAAASVRGPTPSADPGGGRAAPLSGVPDPARGADEAACEGRLPALAPGDALIATEQAIQLDELINWVGAQARIPLTGKDDGYD